MNNKLVYISLLRVVAMVSVVFYHCCCGFSDIWPKCYSYGSIPIYSRIVTLLQFFHMPLFVMISGFLYGYLCKQRGLSSFFVFVEKKGYRVLMPYLFWGVLVCFIQKIDLIQLFYGVAHLWFLLFIFEAYIFYYCIDKYFIRKIKWRKNLICIIAYIELPLSASIISILGENSSFLCFNMFLRYIPYYIFGVYLYDFNKEFNVTQRKYIWIILCATCIFCVIFKYIPLYGLLTLSSLLIITAFFLYIANLKKCCSNRFISLLDECSMGIYLLHHIIIQEMNISVLGRNMMHHYYLYPMLQFILVMIISTGEAVRKRLPAIQKSYNLKV